MTAPIAFREALAFWFKLGCISFGGPAGQIALMHQELVERRRWISEGRFVQALNYCMVLPGPEAQQLATYLGWLMHRTWGGIAAGALFVLPSLLLILGLGWIYMAYGHLAWVAGVLAGIKPAVVALVAQAAYRLGQRTLRHAWHWGLASAAFVALAGFDVAFPWVIATAALVGIGLNRWQPGAWARASHGAGQTDTSHPPALIDDHTPAPAHAHFSWRRLGIVLCCGLTLALLPWAALVAGWGREHALPQMAQFFTQAALLTFGGAYAVLPYVVQGAVETHGWVSAAQMMDGLALGESTPGPLIMVVAFVGFVGGYAQAWFGPDAAGMAGVVAACVVTWFTFLPSFVFILAGGPLVEQTHRSPQWQAPLGAISAAVVGVIVQLALFFAGHTLWPNGWSGGLDAFSLILTLGAAWALLRARLAVGWVLVGCGLLGVARSWV